MNKENIIYLAGFLDGEGSFSLVKSRRKYHNKEGYYDNYWVFLSVTNTDESVIKWIKTITGTGFIYSKSPRGNRKKQFIWGASASQAYLVIESVLPFLKVKSVQATLLKEFQEQMDKQRKERLSQGRGALVKQEYWRLREHYYLLLKELNRRGR